MAIELETSGADLMAILEQTDVSDDLDIDFASVSSLSPSSQAGEPPSPPQLSEGSRDGSGLASSDPSLDLSWPEYLQKVKETFIKARPLEDVRQFAAGMLFSDWMDYVIKLLPKDIKIQGEVNFKHLIAEFGPIDKSQYRLGSEPVEELEFCEVKE